MIEVFKKNQSTEVTDDHYLKATNIVIEASTNITIKVGSSFIAIEAGGIKIGTNGKIVLDAKQDIEEKSAMNVKIEGTMNFEAKGGIAAKVEGSATAELKGAMTTVDGSGMCKIKGGVVMIN